MWSSLATRAVAFADRSVSGAAQPSGGTLASAGGGGSEGAGAVCFGAPPHPADAMSTKMTAVQERANWTGTGSGG